MAAAIEKGSDVARGARDCYFDGMPRLMIHIFALAIANVVFADDAIQGNFTGDWSGSSGAGGTFRLPVVQEGGKAKCAVSVSFAGEEVVTNVTLCETDGAKIEAQYDFDLGANRLQSTIHGERKGKALEGKYQTKPLAGRAQVDEGDWKGAPAQ